MDRKRIRIFISSPSDVAEERVHATRLVRRLAEEFRDRAFIEAILWEYEPLLAHDTFQKQIPRPSECEIVACILWWRLGTRLPAQMTRPDGSRYASGTEYEFEDALEGHRRNGYPSLLVYRKTARVNIDLLDDEEIDRRRAQRDAVQSFVDKWFVDPSEGVLKSAFHPFETSAKFEELLEEHLRKLITRQLPAEGETSEVIAKPSWTSGSPFLGLKAFDTQHAPVFFGRTLAISNVVDALRAQAADGRAFVMVTGISGGGKSSLVRAGVAPLVTQPGVIEGVSVWRRAIFKPSDAPNDPIMAIAAALLGADALPELASNVSIDELAETLRRHPESVTPHVRTGLAHAVGARGGNDSNADVPAKAMLLLVADQLEEIFTIAQIKQRERESFIAALGALARSGHVFVLATLRSDFYHRCIELPELVALKKGAGQYDLLPPTPGEIGQMIRNPARAAALRFEEDPNTKISLDEVLREAAAAGPESLPLMEFALEELYRRRRGDLLTYEAYKEIGGVEGALARRAEEVYAALAAGVQATLAPVFRNLVSIGENSSIARRECPLADVVANPDARDLIDAFVKARLLTSDRLSSGTPIVRVAHEALLRNWPRLSDHIEQEREFFLIRSRISAAAHRWQRESRNSDLLLSQGKPLEEARSLVEAWKEELDEGEKEFIAASIRRERRRKRGKQLAAAVLVALVLCTLLAIMIANTNKKQAAADRALAQRRLEQMGDTMTLYRDTDRRLAKIPHSTPARLILAEETLTYLDRRSADTQGDSAFTIGLAEAYITVGDVLGNPFEDNSGNVTQALTIYQKSQNLLEGLTAREPANDKAWRTLGTCYRKTAQVLGNTDNRRNEQLASELKALEIWKKVVAANGSDRNAIGNECSAYVGVGDGQWELGRYVEAAENYQKSLEIAEQLKATAPHDPDQKWEAAKAVSKALERLALVYASAGQSAQALASGQRCLELRTQMLQEYEARTSEITFFLVVTYRRIGDAQVELNDLAIAADSFNQSLSRARRLLENDRGSARNMIHLSKSCVACGNVKLWMGQAKEALECYREGLTLAKAAGRADPTAAEPQAFVLHSAHGIVEAHIKLGTADTVEAGDAVKESLDIGQKWIDRDPECAEAQIALALAHLGAARRFAWLASHEISVDRRNGLWKNAGSEFESVTGVVEGMQSARTFDQTYAKWFGTLARERSEAKQALTAAGTPSSSLPGALR